MSLISPVMGISPGTNWRVVDALIVDSPTADGKKRVLCYALSDIRVTHVFSVLPGGSAGPSVTATFKYSSDVSRAGTELVAGGFVTSGTKSTTTGILTALAANAVVPAGNILWVEITAVSGTVPQFHLSTVS